MNAYIAQIRMTLRLTFRNRVALAFSYGSRYYADVLLERQSVLRSGPLC